MRGAVAMASARGQEADVVFRGKLGLVVSLG